jgi:hypothetical protein
MAPWIWFVSRDFAVFIAQKQTQAQSYTLGLGSVPGELARYAPVISAAAQGHIASLLWITLVLTGIILLTRSGWRQHHGARLLSIALAVLLVSFALLVRRSYQYLGTVWPLLALAASFALLHPWPPRLRAGARAALVLLVLVSSSTGVIAYRQMAARARQTSAYSTVCDRIAQDLPRSARLLALQHWWLGVGPRVKDYRSFHVPLTRMDTRVTAHPISFAAAMALDPMDFILIDPEMADVLRAAGDPARPRASPFAIEIVAFLKHNAVAVGGFDDQTYGRFTLYRVHQPDAGK